MRRLLSGEIISGIESLCNVSVLPVRVDVLRVRSELVLGNSLNYCGGRPSDWKLWIVNPERVTLSGSGGTLFTAAFTQPSPFHSGFVDIGKIFMDPYYQSIIEKALPKKKGGMCCTN